MARPQKNSCDYFTHDHEMRNHRKVKSIRNKFGVQGYAIWSMLLEYLTGMDGNEFEYSDMEFELISGDFGVSVTEIRDVVDYCIKLEMLFNLNGFVYSESLNKRLEPVYLKRGKAKESSEKQKRKNGKFVEIDKSTEQTVVTVTETPQSKVKEIKENIIIKTEIPEFVKKEQDKLKAQIAQGKQDDIDKEPLSQLVTKMIFITESNPSNFNTHYQAFRGFHKGESKESFLLIVDEFFKSSIFEYPRLIKESSKHFGNWLRTQHKDNQELIEKSKKPKSTNLRFTSGYVNETAEIY